MRVIVVPGACLLAQKVLSTTEGHRGFLGCTGRCLACSRAAVCMVVVGRFLSFSPFSRSGGL